MSMLVAVIAVLSLFCLTEGIVIWGLGRRIIAQQGISNSTGLPAPGFIPKLNDPVQEEFGWPTGLLSGERVVVMVTKGCGPCSKIIEQIRGGHVSSPVHLVASAGDFSNAYRDELTHANSSSVTVTSNSLTSLNGWKNPTAFPAVFKLSDGVVVSGTHEIEKS